MKITDVRAYTLACRLPRKMGGAFRNPGGWDSRQALLVRVETDTGLVGWGESFAFPSVGSAIVRDVLRPMLIGQDPLQGEPLWDRLYFGLGYGGVKGAMVEALSGVDIALWDLKGKFLGKSVSQLLAEDLDVPAQRIRHRVDCYATGLYYEPLADLLSEARAYLDEGFRALKMKIGLGEDEDLRRVRTLREAIGADVNFKVDANCAYTLAAAREMERRLRPFDIDWFEEPLRVEDLVGYEALKQEREVRIASGEGEYCRWGFDALMPLVDVAQPDVARCGGLTEMVRIVRRAAELGCPIAPHAWTGAVCLAASLHVAAVAPTFEIFEYDRTPSPLRDALTREPFHYSDSTLSVPQGPGLGIDLDVDVLLRHTTAVV